MDGLGCLLQKKNDLIRMIFMCAMKQVNDMCLGQKNASLISCKNI